MPSDMDVALLLEKFESYIGNAYSARKQLQLMVQEHKTAVLQLHTSQLQLEKSKQRAEATLKLHKKVLAEELERRYQEALVGLEHELELQQLPLDANITLMTKSIKQLEATSLALGSGIKLKASDSIEAFSRMSEQLQQVLLNGGVALQVAESATSEHVSQLFQRCQAVKQFQSLRLKPKQPSAPPPNHCASAISSMQNYTDLHLLPPHSTSRQQPTAADVMCRRRAADGDAYASNYKPGVHRRNGEHLDQHCPMESPSRDAANCCSSLAMRLSAGTPTASPVHMPLACLSKAHQKLQGRTPPGHVSVSGAEGGTAAAAGAQAGGISYAQGPIQADIADRDAQQKQQQFGCTPIKPVQFHSCPGCMSARNFPALDVQDRGLSPQQQQQQHVSFLFPGTVHVPLAYQSEDEQRWPESTRASATTRNTRATFGTVLSVSGKAAKTAAACVKDTTDLCKPADDARGGHQNRQFVDAPFHPVQFQSCPGSLSPRISPALDPQDRGRSQQQQQQQQQQQLQQQPQQQQKQGVQDPLQHSSFSFPGAIHVPAAYRSGDQKKMDESTPANATLRNTRTPAGSVPLGS